MDDGANLDKNGVRLTRAGKPDKRFRPPLESYWQDPPKERKPKFDVEKSSLASIGRETLKRLGGIDWLVKQCERFPAKGVEFISKSIGSGGTVEIDGFTYTIQSVHIEAGPPCGVITPGLPMAERVQ
jgi:hypothetical protein